MQTPFYTLHQRIKDKFGDDNMEASVFVITGWMCFEFGSVWSEDNIGKMCRAKTFEEFPITLAEAEHLRRLFSLRSINDMFTFPELIPASILEEKKPKVITSIY